MNTFLYPPLPLIEHGLFGPGEPEPASAADLVDPSQPVNAPVPALPDYLAALMRRKAGATLSLTPGAPAVGDIRALTIVPEQDGTERRLGRTCAVLLGRWTGGRHWAGWMVAQEADYAAERDLVLQDDDGVLAPEAAMVQTWNPVDVELRGDEALLGRLSATALGTVLKLSDHTFTDAQFVPPRPGRVGAWDIDQDTTVVTGTTLGDDGDPRIRYQELYRTLATEFTTVAAATRARGANAGRQSVPGWMERLRNTFVRPAWTFGAMAVVMGQAVWMLAGQPYGSGEETLYRSAPTAVQSEACLTRIRVMFRLDTPYADLVLVLRRIDATLVNGPSETGEVWLLPAPDQDPREVVDMLRQSHLVERSDVVQPDIRQCRR